MPNILQREVLEEETKDLEKFGMLLTEFLKIEPFASSPSTSFRCICSAGVLC